MADANVNTVSITEKQKVKEITDKLEEGLKELFESEKKAAFLPCQNSIITVSTTRS